MELVEGMNLEETKLRVVDANGEVNEYTSKEEARNALSK
jgi:hypothetical protein